MMLLGLSGSLRDGSTNTLLLHEAARLYGVPLTLADIRFPLFDADAQDADGIPEAVKTVAGQIETAEAVLIATPEYNQSLSGVLKNALDWISRVDGNPWLDKPVALLSAAAGRSGGARGNYALRLAMTPFKARLLSRELLVAGSRKAFDDEGRLIGEQYQSELGDYMEALKREVARG